MEKREKLNVSPRKKHKYGCKTLNTRNAVNIRVFKETELIERMESILIAWIREKQMKGLPLNYEIIYDKAEEIFKKLKAYKNAQKGAEFNIEEFKPSRDWYNNFLQKKSIDSFLFEIMEVESEDEMVNNLDGESSVLNDIHEPDKEDDQPKPDNENNNLKAQDSSFMEVDKDTDTLPPEVDDQNQSVIKTSILRLELHKTEINMHNESCSKTDLQNENEPELDSPYEDPSPKEEIPKRVLRSSICKTNTASNFTKTALDIDSTNGPNRAEMENNSACTDVKAKNENYTFPILDDSVLQNIFCKKVSAMHNNTTNKLELCTSAYSKLKKKIRPIVRQEIIEEYENNNAKTNELAKKDDIPASTETLELSNKAYSSNSNVRKRHGNATKFYSLEIKRKLIKDYACGLPKTKIMKKYDIPYYRLNEILLNRMEYIEEDMVKKCSLSNEEEENDVQICGTVPDEKNEQTEVIHENRCLDLSLKIESIRMRDAGERPCDIGREINVPSNTLFDTYRYRRRYIAQYILKYAMVKANQNFSDEIIFSREDTWIQKYFKDNKMYQLKRKPSESILQTKVENTVLELVNEWHMLGVSLSKNELIKRAEQFTVTAYRKMYNVTNWKTLKKKMKTDTKQFLNTDSKWYDDFQTRLTKVTIKVVDNSPVINSRSAGQLKHTTNYNIAIKGNQNKKINTILKRAHIANFKNLNPGKSSNLNMEKTNTPDAGQKEYYSKMFSLLNAWDTVKSLMPLHSNKELARDLVKNFEVIGISDFRKQLRKRKFRDDKETPKLLTALNLSHVSKKDHQSIQLIEQNEELMNSTQDYKSNECKTFIRTASVAKCPKVIKIDKQYDFLMSKIKTLEDEMALLKKQKTS